MDLLGPWFSHIKCFIFSLHRYSFFRWCKNMCYIYCLWHYAQPLWLLSFLPASEVSVLKALARRPLTPFPFLYLSQCHNISIKSLLSIKITHTLESSPRSQSHWGAPSFCQIQLLSLCWLWLWLSWLAWPAEAVYPKFLTTYGQN